MSPARSRGWRAARVYFQPFSLRPRIARLRLRSRPLPTGRPALPRAARLAWTSLRECPPTLMQFSPNPRRQVADCPLELLGTLGRLGHATAAFTMDRYGHYLESADKAATEVMAGFWRRIGRPLRMGPFCDGADHSATSRPGTSSLLVNARGLAPGSSWRGDGPAVRGSNLVFRR